MTKVKDKELKNKAFGQQNVENAIAAIKANAKEKVRKFAESLDLILVVNKAHLTQDNTSIRGTVKLPFGKGKKSSVAYFAKDKDEISTAMSAGAQIAGTDKIFDYIEKNKINFDFCLATPDVMQLITKVAKKLGPRGLMPNQKDGTISTLIEQSTADFVNCMTKFKLAKNGIIQCAVGTIPQDIEHLVKNVNFAILTISSLLPKNSPFSGIYLKSTMGATYSIKIEN